MQRQCPLCNGVSAPLDVVDFNKSCMEQRGKYLPLLGVPVYYFLCGECGFCFAPEFADWSPEDFETKIYNSGYAEVDPDYAGKRPQANARLLLKLFGDRGRDIRHLDYGGGSGLLCSLLREANWHSVSYDPFVDGEMPGDAPGKFDLVTAYEVFEHVADPKRLASTVSVLLADDGVILFSTLLSDGHIAPRQRLGWWYASPRNGHISLFSRKSLRILGASQGFRFGSFSASFHAFWKTVPPWAEHIIRIRKRKALP